MSAKTVEPVSSTRHWGLNLACDATARLSVADPGIDDPVNNTGIGPQHGDLQPSNEFAYLVRVMCDEGGTFS